MTATGHSIAHISHIEEIVTCRRQRYCSQHKVVGQQMAAVAPEVVDASSHCRPRRCQLLGASHPQRAPSTAERLMPAWQERDSTTG